MSIKETIRAEIERRKKENMYVDLPMSIGRYYEDRDLLAFLDSLPEQPVESLEETADLLAIAHLQGMEQQKAKMLEDAMKAVVTTNLANRPIIYLDELQGFQYGEKVKIIIVKEDEK